VINEIDLDHGANVFCIFLCGLTEKLKQIQGGANSSNSSSNSTKTPGTSSNEKSQY